MNAIPIEINQLGNTLSLPIALSFSKEKKAKTLMQSQIAYYQKNNKILEEFLSNYLEEGTVKEANTALSVAKMLLPSFNFSLSNMRSIGEKIYEPTLLNLHTKLVEEMSLYLSHLDSWVAFSNAIIEGKQVDENDANYTAFASNLAETITENEFINKC